MRDANAGPEATPPDGQRGERCFACGKRLGANPTLVDTRDDQLVFVGRECLRLVLAAGESGYRPPQGGPRLYPLAAMGAPADAAR